VQFLSGQPEWVDTPSNSGKGQRIARCPTCRVALMSAYVGAGPLFRFVRVGTLERPADCPPDIHIFTSTKLPWVVLPEGVPATEGYYRRDAFWPQSSLERRRIAIEG
jgi:hypothetical protein